MIGFSNKIAPILSFRLLRDAGQAPGANMVITASQDGGNKPVLGATVAMDKLKFPVMMQVAAEIESKALDVY